MTILVVPSSEIKWTNDILVFRCTDKMGTNVTFGFPLHRFVVNNEILVVNFTDMMGKNYATIFLALM